MTISKLLEVASCDERKKCSVRASRISEEKIQNRQLRRFQSRIGRIRGKNDADFDFCKECETRRQRHIILLICFCFCLGKAIE